jgi:hypothetical protein
VDTYEGWQGVKINVSRSAFLFISSVPRPGTCLIHIAVLDYCLANRVMLELFPSRNFTHRKQASGRLPGCLDFPRERRSGAARLVDDPPVLLVLLVLLATNLLSEEKTERHLGSFQAISSLPRYLYGTSALAPTWKVWGDPGTQIFSLIPDASRPSSRHAVDPSAPQAAKGGLAYRVLYCWVLCSCFSPFVCFSQEHFSTRAQME